ncbi:MAG: hypothetical protein Q4E33_03625 [Erysipelotrichaceae bacterium]|nr:hypothetical protein [Erysipelotrichaceae bacterium]
MEKIDMGMKANSGFFNGTSGNTKYKLNIQFFGEDPKNGIDYNSAGSKSINSVTYKTITKDKKIPMTAKSNSVKTKLGDGGKILQERYYDSKGKAYLDIDYTNHGNPKMHPNVPHEHDIHFTDNTPIRGAEKEINK